MVEKRIKPELREARGCNSSIKSAGDFLKSLLLSEPWFFQLYNEAFGHKDL